jgi:hypothetical protein
MRKKYAPITRVMRRLPCSRHPLAFALFRKVNPSVVVIKAKGRDVSATRGLVRA